MQGGADLEVPVTGITGTKFDQVVVLGEYGHAIGGPCTGSQVDVDPNGAWRETPEAQEAASAAAFRGHSPAMP